MTNSPEHSQIQFSPKKTLILGCGDIGQRLAARLNPAQFEVTGLRRQSLADTSYLRYRQCDVTCEAELRKVLAEGFEIILITMTPSERSDAGYQQTYVATCTLLVAALRDLGLSPELIIFVSSTGVYGQVDGSIVNEDSPTEPHHFSGKRLLEAEDVIRTSGFTHIILRPSGIYGPGRTRLIDQVKQGRASAGTYFTNRIHADDLAGFIAHLITQVKEPESLYIATDSAPTPMIDVVSWIAAQIGATNFLAEDALAERGNKRLSNARMLATGYCLQYKSFKEGYAELILQTGSLKHLP